MKNFDKFSEISRHNTNVFKVASVYNATKKLITDQRVAELAGLTVEQVVNARGKLSGHYGFKFQKKFKSGKPRRKLTKINTDGYSLADNRKGHNPNNEWTPAGLWGVALGLRTA